MMVRSLCAYGGVLLLAAIWLLPLKDVAPRFPLHMVLVALAAPLSVMGFSALGRWFAISPLIAAALEFLLVWAWHLPAAQGLAYRLPMGFALKQASFLPAGIFSFGQDAFAARRRGMPGRRWPGQPLCCWVSATPRHRTDIGRSRTGFCTPTLKMRPNCAPLRQPPCRRIWTTPR